MKKILITKRTDGGCGITDLSHVADVDMEQAIFLATHYAVSDEKGILVRNKEGNPIFVKYPNILSWRLTSKENIPASREFRNAWTDDFETETVDIHPEKLNQLTKS